jgi:hypothetical protein
MHHKVIRRMRRLSDRRREIVRRVEAGMTTAEYAVGTIAACAFAGLLILVIKSGPVRSMLAKIINAALSSAL